MGRVTSNATGFARAREASLGVLPGSPAWKSIEPNTVSKFGNSYTKEARDPLNGGVARRKGNTTDLTSGVEFVADTTLSALRDCLEEFARTRAIGPDSYAPSAAVAGGYTVAALSAAQAGRFLFTAANGATTLVGARGFSTAANNGAKLITSAVAAAATTVPVAGNVAEVPAATADVEVAIAGVRAAAGDLKVDANGNITSTALDFTVLGLVVGQVIHVGGQDITNQFFNPVNLGFARVVAVAAHVLTLAKREQPYVVDDGTSNGAGGTTLRIDLLFGQFIRNVPPGSVDYLETSVQFEASYPNLDGSGATQFEYAKGNYPNTLRFELPLSGRSTLTFAYVGTDTSTPTTARATNAASAKAPGQTSGFATSSDLARLRVEDVDETGLTTDFKSLTLTINNNAAPEKVLGKMAAKYMNAGNFYADVESTLLFTNSAVIERIRCNRTVGLDFAIRNGDGGVHIDLPQGTLGGGDRAFPANQSVTIATSFMSHEEAGGPGFSFGASLFPLLPKVACA